MRDRSTAEILELFDIDESTLKRWVKNGCPCDKGGKGIARKFDEGEVTEWLQANRLTGKVGRPKEAMSANLEAAKLRKENLIIELKEIELAQKKGLLIDKAKVEEANVRKIVAVKNVLLGFGASIAPTLEGLTTPEIHQQIHTRIGEILEQFSK